MYGVWGARGAAAFAEVVAGLAQVSLGITSRLNATAAGTETSQQVPSTPQILRQFQLGGSSVVFRIGKSARQAGALRRVVGVRVKSALVRLRA